MHTTKPVSSNTLFLLGYSHRTAPLEIRERIALSPEQLAQFYTMRQEIPELAECVLLNTCNRVEVYGVSKNTNIKNDVVNYFARLHQHKPEGFENFGYWKTNQDVIAHAFEVAAGLDSQMVGENEILGQIKTAYALATKQEATGPIIHRIFQKSFQAAKWARSHTGISQGHVSIGNVAVDLAKRICGELADIKLLVVGTGEVGQKTAKALHSRGAKQITVASRSIERAYQCAKELAAAAISFDSLATHLADADIVICSSQASSAIIQANTLKQIVKKRSARPLFFIDLGMPRNVESSVARISNVYLYNLDNLSQVANENLKARENEILKARASLHSKAAGLWQKLESLPA